MPKYLSNFFGNDSTGVAVSDMVNEFIDANQPKPTVVDINLISKVDNIKVYTNKSGSREKINTGISNFPIKLLDANEFLVILKRNEHDFEFYKQYLPMSLLFYPDSKNISSKSIVFRPFINSGKFNINTGCEELNGRWNPVNFAPIFDSVVADAVAVKNIVIKFPEKLVKLPYPSPNRPWFITETERSDFTPVLFFEGEAKKEAFSMIKKLKRFCEK